MYTYFSESTLLTPPVERAAFSDRQAYVCAEMAKLAYFKFEGGHLLKDILDVARDFIGDDKNFAILEQQLSNILTSDPTSESESKQAFEAILDGAGFTLVDTFSKEGTQAFLCTKEYEMDGGTKKTVAFLSFRGTEPKQFEDIKTDVRARLIEVDVGHEKVEFHSGFYDSLGLIKDELAKEIAAAKYDQLFVTGHSLGGALAIIYTRLFAPSSNGACYTFGAPPVGAVEVQNGLKTPVYEIINELDIVPRLPNPWLVGFTSLLLKIIRLLGKVFTIVNKVLLSGTWDETWEDYIKMLTRYRHPGYVSYLVGSGKEARLRYNVNSWDRLGWWRKMILKKSIGGFKKLVSDHMIDLYIEKLRQHALKRQ